MNISHDTHGVGVVFWTDHTPSCPIHTLRHALEYTGLAPELARDLAKRYCFVRAKNKLKDEGLILLVGETEQRITFQLSDKIINDRERIELDYKAMVWFDKTNQTINCDNWRIRDKARSLFEQAGEIYPPDRINELVKRIFRQHNAIVPLRSSGGLYFVPQCYQEIMDKVSVFLRQIGAEVYTSPVGLTQEDIRTKAIAMLVESMQSDLKAITDDVKANGLTKVKAEGRFQKLCAQVKRAADFAESLKAHASDILVKASSAEIDLSLIACADGIDLIAGIVKTGHLSGVLGDIALAATQGMELPAPDSQRMQDFMAHALDLDSRKAGRIQQDAIPIMPELPEEPDPVSAELAAIVSKHKQEAHA